MTSKLTRRAILAGSAAAFATATVPSLPGAISTSAMASTSGDPLLALAARSAVLNRDARLSYFRYRVYKEAAKSEDGMREMLTGPLATLTDEQRALFVKNVAVYVENGCDLGDEEETEALICEQEQIEEQLTKTPARTLAGLRAKLRWISDNLSDDAIPDLPKLETAYNWDGGNDKRDRMIASAWADAERLLSDPA